MHIWSRNQPKSKRMRTVRPAITASAPLKAAGSVASPLQERPPADEVGDERGGHQERDDRPDRPLRRLDRELASAPGGRVQLPLLQRPSLEERLDGTEEELEVDGLRAGVAAPHPAERRADEEDGHDDAEAEGGQEQVVGGVEGRRRRCGSGASRGRGRRPGCPPTGISGSAKKRTKRPYAIDRRIFQKRPLWTIGCMNFRLPSAEML